MWYSMDHTQLMNLYDICSLVVNLVAKESHLANISTGCFSLGQAEDIYKLHVVCDLHVHSVQLTYHRELVGVLVNRPDIAQPV